MPAMTKEIATAGPDCFCATSPVTTKMPAPMTTPTPKTVRSSADRLFFSRCSGSSVSRMESSTDLMRRVPRATASSSVPAPAGSSRRPGSVARAAGARLPTLQVPVTGAGGAGGAPLSSDTSPPVPQRLPPELARGRTPPLRPRPAGAAHPGPGRRPDAGLVVDCAVYVDGVRHEPQDPHDALREAAECG